MDSNQGVYGSGTLKCSAFCFSWNNLNRAA